MKKLHQMNLALTWVCTVALSVTSFFTSENPFQSIATMVVASLIATLIYFVPVNDIVKGVLLVDVISAAALTLSIMQGGNVHCYIVSFIVLGLAGLYFEPQIMNFHLFTYLPYCVIAYIINPFYISGPTEDKATGLFFILVYFFVGCGIILTTKRGKKNLKQSEQQRKESEIKEQKLKESNEKSFEVSQKLNDIVTNSKEEFNKLNEESRSITESTEKMASVMEQTSQFVGDVNHTVTDSKEKIETNYNLAKDLKQSYERVSESINVGEEQGGQMKNSMDTIDETVTNAKDSTTALLENTHKITGILAQINQIANQTNLLALNASIEAARAGEHGRGFAVVADEIRTLSEQSHDASSNIQVILNQLVQDITEVSQKIVIGADSVTESKENLKKLLEVLNQIQESSKESEKFIDQQFSIIGVVKNNFDCMSEEVKNVVTMTEESSTMIDNIAKSIQQQNEHVNNVTNTFDTMGEISIQLVEER